MKTVTLAVAAVGLLATSTLALEPLTIKGSKFFHSDGTQYYMKGIAYQRSPLDPLIDKKQCQMDAKLMKELGANAIRVYHVDSSADHTDCMKAFEDIGVYAFIDLDDFPTYIEQDGPPHWNDTQLTAYTKTLDNFAGFSNLGGVFVGNEIITRSNGSFAAPYIKAAVRDVKAYMEEKKFARKIPTGYSAADIAELRPNLQNYLACGDDMSVNVDFFGLNAYEWCGEETDYHISGYDQLNKNATDYPVPIFFSETGCNVPTPRTFKDQFAIFGPEMQDVWSGAIIYEWIQEDNKYGLIDYGSADPKTAIGGDTWARGGTPTPLPDFTVLRDVWSSVSPTGVKLDKYTSTNGPISCPDSTSGIWNVNPTSALPTLGQTAQAAEASGTPADRAAATTNSGAATTTSSQNAAGTNEAMVRLSGGLVAAVIAAAALL
ncbi:1,3-beta-glucanosyltransferase gas2 [Drechslerella dactyloides]|uniref:1,3-beta-glucanosyltransferase n=1 Tax=Drechslerella dactyloides TaxID=74499 RepID=A0AAD6NKK2_DREDA|nr:1,3-beta-glucanosyltransferase gas2 [Drechslerella dactyloides]